MNEKEEIEKATAEAFIKLYNSEYDTHFSIIEYSDAPDIRCKDPNGNTLNLEITLTEDRPRDIQAMLGRSDHKSIESLKEHLDKVKKGKADPFEYVSSLSGNVLIMIISRIEAKLKKDYGNNVALVIRDTSPVGWNWGSVIDKIRSHFPSLKKNPFDRGIFIITFKKDKIYRIL